MSKHDFATVLRERGFSVWAERVESGSADAIDALMSIANYGGNKKIVGEMCRILGGHRDAEFFMVYREGGRSPTFKHSTEDAAITEANRVARASGEKTYVLAAVKAIDPYAMPTVDEFKRHANECRHGTNGNWGLWRVTRPDSLPAIVAVRVSPSGEPYCSVDSPWGTSVEQWAKAKWERLDANGKDLVEDDCPF